MFEFAAGTRGYSQPDDVLQQRFLAATSGWGDSGARVGTRFLERHQELL